MLSEGSESPDSGPAITRPISGRVMSASFRLLGRREVPSVISKQPGGGRVFSLTSFPLGVWPNILGGPWTSACCRGFLYSLGWWCLLLYPISAVSAHPGVQKEQFYFSQTDKAHKPPFPLKNIQFCQFKENSRDFWNIFLFWVSTESTGNVPSFLFPFVL